MCYITFPELLYNMQIWLYNIQDGYITHPNLPDDWSVKKRGHTPACSAVHCVWADKLYYKLREGTELMYLLMQRDRQDLLEQRVKHDGGGFKFHGK